MGKFHSSLRSLIVSEPDCLTSYPSGFDLTMVSGSCSEECSEQNGFASLAEESCHCYGSKHGNSSIRTREIRKEASRRSLSKAGKEGKKQRSRQNRKMHLLNYLDVPITVDRQEEIEEVRRSGKKVYIGGISPNLLPTTLPYGCLQWSVHSHLIPYLNPSGNGCRAGSNYTLLPRFWIKKCFPTTQKFFSLFMRLLDLHPGVDPRGQKKVPVYERSTPATYVVLGTSARRSGRGLQLMDRKLKEEGHRNNRLLLKKFFRQVAHAARAYLDTPSIRYLSVVKELTNFTEFTFDSSPDAVIWPSLAVAANVVMEMHTDEDYVMGCAGVLGGDGYRTHDAKGSDILQYFCFPGTGSAVGLRNGDLLLFNPTVPHCVSSRCTLTEDVICTSFYLKTAIVGGNDNSALRL